MTVLSKIPHGIAKSVSRPMLSFLNEIRTVVNSKIEEVDSATQDNVAVFDENGQIADSGKDIPDGAIVGTTDEQTLTNKTLESPTIETPSIESPTIDDFSNANHDHSDAAGGGVVVPVAATQSDATNASGTPADLSEAVTKTDFNAAVTVINALIDKLQAAGLMT